MSVDMRHRLQTTLFDNYSDPESPVETELPVGDEDTWCRYDGSPIDPRVFLSIQSRDDIERALEKGQLTETQVDHLNYIVAYFAKALEERKAGQKKGIWQKTRDLHGRSSARASQMGINLINQVFNLSAYSAENPSDDTDYLRVKRRFLKVAGRLLDIENANSNQDAVDVSGERTSNRSDSRPYDSADWAERAAGDYGHN